MVQVALKGNVVQMDQQAQVDLLDHQVDQEKEVLQDQRDLRVKVDHQAQQGREVIGGQRDQPDPVVLQDHLGQVDKQEPLAQEETLVLLAL